MRLKELNFILPIPLPPTAVLSAQSLTVDSSVNDVVFPSLDSAEVVSRGSGGTPSVLQRVGEGECLFM